MSGRGRGCSSVVLVACCVDSGLCVELISCAKECYRLCVMTVSDTRRPRPELGCRAKRKK